MKAHTICSLLMAVSTALAVPAKRAEEAVTISGLWASETSETADVQFILVDANYDDTTDASLSWERPGPPVTDSRTEDGNYWVDFPGGVSNITSFTLAITRVKGPEIVEVTVNANETGSLWTCQTSIGSMVTTECRYSGNITVYPTSS
ncbi:uncharacterized protein BO80DRAFT_59061 [Aspergillus ibericus CBS 121593]|uniref:Ig-like domain-containing protein n=1 Tax=Aspergillus ibericus CBS 121593 TaxID=1448316 RepID=A0A395H0W5_9EURO|nr:hypothetical protein BO80DRAFT_59061 [Aspergillus ibericus CBS 121593]RAL01466.1 hypothetical protein BO80DRAFT_59061 [Aspergillus ibericus CBS 121593]